MSEQAFYDPSTGRTLSWRQVLRHVRRRVSNRVPSVGRTQVDDALQHAVGDLALGSSRHPARYVDGASGLYDVTECLDFLRRRTLQRIAREARKAEHELEALMAVDTPGVRSALNSLSSAGADPHDVVSNRAFYNQVVTWFASLPEAVRKDFELLLSPRTQADLAAELGVSQQAVAQRRATLSPRIRRLAIEAGLLEHDGTYDGASGSRSAQRAPRGPGVDPGGIGRHENGVSDG